MIKPDEIVDWCKRNGSSAAVITDHDNLCAAVQLYKACKREDLKPIYGMEVSVAPDKSEKVRGAKNLVLVAKNITGFKNLIKLSTLGSMYFYYRPRIDISDIRKYSEGLIAITSCLYGLTAAAYFSGGDKGLLKQVIELRTIFGDDLYLEIQPTAKDTQRVYNEACHSLAAEMPWVKLIATGDPHYLNKEDREFHEHFMRIKTITDDSWVYPFQGDYHVRNYDEMVEAFADLHGYDLMHDRIYAAAMSRPMELISEIDRYDIKEGIKIPTSFV